MASSGIRAFSIFSLSNPETFDPIEGEVEVILYSTDPGTTIVTASSGDLILSPEEGYEVVFYQTADHIELSADPLSIEADGHDISIITATVCDASRNRVANYNGSITFTTTEGIFPYSGVEGQKTIVIVDGWDEGKVWVELTSEALGTATVTAESNDDGLDSTGYNATVVFTGNIATEISDPFNITNWDDYRISLDINVSGSPLYLKKIKVEWDNSHAFLNDFKIYDKQEMVYLLDIQNIGLLSPYNKTMEEVTTLTIEKGYTIYLHFGDVSDAQAKMKNNNLIVTITGEDNIEYPLSFKVP